MTFFDELNKYKIILASKSPRRQQLFNNLFPIYKNEGLNFEIKTKEVEEIYPENLKEEQIALYLSELKANAFKNEELDCNTIVITADTIVCLNNNILDKPKNYEEAVKTLKLLSGNKHTVITGVCIKSTNKIKSFYVSTDVYFKHLSLDEINFYVKNYKPYDKAGAYGIQEWIGYIGIEKIEGSFYNVMGLPTNRLYEELLDF